MTALLAALFLSLFTMDGDIIQLIPDLGPDEVEEGEAKGVETPNGFTLDFAWKNNHITGLTVKCNVKKADFKVRTPGRIPFYSPLLRNKKTYVQMRMYKDQTHTFRATSSNQDGTEALARIKDEDLTSDEARRIAENVMLYQLNSGAWPKNNPEQEPLSEEEKAEVLTWKDHDKSGTLDNGATTSEMNFMARMYKANHDRRYLASLLKGLKFLFYMQYPSGGFAQTDPKKGGYWARVTFNDNAMINTLYVLKAIAEGRAPFDIPEITEGVRKMCEASYKKGIDFILKSQIVQNGVKTAWCQQYDPSTLEPLGGRAFELPSISTSESYTIGFFLMDQPYSPEIDAAMTSLTNWISRSVMVGWKVEPYTFPNGEKGEHLVETGDEDDRLWARYYELDTNRPFTANRQSVKDYTFQAQKDGSMSYMWFNAKGDWFVGRVTRWFEKRARAEAKAKRAAEKKAYAEAKARRAAEKAAARP